MAWGPGDTELLLTDPAIHAILRLTLDGNYPGPLVLGDGKPIDTAGPISLQANPGGYLLQDRPWRWVYYSRNFLPVRVLEPTLYPPAVNFVTFVENGGEFIGYGRVKNPQDGWTTGVVRVSTDQLALLEVIEEIPVDSRRGDLFSTVPGGWVALAGAVYGLVFDEPSHILEIKPDRRFLRSFPDGFAVLPALPESRGPETMVARFQALAQSKLPVALYGHGAHLYLLTREPKADKTLWRLHQIDPQRDVLVRSLTLPTTAPHLSLLPGDKEWIVLERGPVLGPGQQKVESMLRIPTPWIEDPQNTALSGETPVLCR